MKRRFFYLFPLIIYSFPLEAQVSLEIVGEVRQLTPDDQYFMRPSWSPGGETLAFTSRNHQGIWLVDLTSGTITEAVSKPGAGYEFAWSPDGRYIAYRAQVKEKKRTFQTIESYEIESGKIQLIQEPVRVLGTPIWGPDNASIFYTGDRQLRTKSTELETSLLFKQSSPSPSRLIAFTSGHELHVASVSDSLQEEFIFPDRRILNPSISPDGRKVVYETLDGDIVIENLASGKRVVAGQGHRPSWSPDGLWTCFMVTVDDGHQYLSSEIVIAGADGETSFELTKSKEELEMNPVWSPNGKSIAYDEHRTGAILISDIKLQ